MVPKSERRSPPHLQRRLGHRRDHHAADRAADRSIRLRRFVITARSACCCWSGALTPIPRRTRTSAPRTPFIESDPPDSEAHANIPWLRLLRVKETWAFAIAKFLIDPICGLSVLAAASRGALSLDLKSSGRRSCVDIIVHIAARGWMSSQLIKMGSPSTPRAS